MHSHSSQDPWRPQQAAPTSSQLTDADRQKMERNRLAALERRRLATMRHSGNVGHVVVPDTSSFQRYPSPQNASTGWSAPSISSLPHNDHHPPPQWRRPPQPPPSYAPPMSYNYHPPPHQVWNSSPADFQQPPTTANCLPPTQNTPPPSARSVFFTADTYPIHDTHGCWSKLHQNTAPLETAAGVAPRSATAFWTPPPSQPGAHLNATTTTSGTWMQPPCVHSTPPVARHHHHHHQHEPNENSSLPMADQLKPQVSPPVSTHIQADTITGDTAVRANDTQQKSAAPPVVPRQLPVEKLIIKKAAYNGPMKKLSLSKKKDYGSNTTFTFDAAAAGKKHTPKKLTQATLRETMMRYREKKQTVAAETKTSDGDDVQQSSGAPLESLVDAQTAKNAPSSIAAATTSTTTVSTTTISTTTPPTTESSSHQHKDLQRGDDARRDSSEPYSLLFSFDKATASAATTTTATPAKTLRASSLAARLFKAWNR